MTNNKKRKKKVTSLALICTITIILLVTSTYAWFIGMRTVDVESFDVEIAAIDGLSLSLDGRHFSESLKVSEAQQYDDNTNVWAENGLKPVSTIGKINTDSATLQLYEKASLTPTDGGYRLLASRVPNYDKKVVGEVTTYPEAEGYVAFDLFIKNLSGKQYYGGKVDYNNEEAIYLTNDSTVTVAKDGVENTGIENSVRVAFAQIGRTKAVPNTASDDEQNALAATAIKLGCTGETDDITGICDSRLATIWEPNDRQHTKAAIDNYNVSCKHRNDATSYGEEGTCKDVVDGFAYPTYVISKEINYRKNEDGEPYDPEEVVDVYDGPAYNGYSTHIGTADVTNADETTALKTVDTFTDTKKLSTGVERPEFFRLAPNSVTKVRVYIYIEGQDVDNFDLASIGKKISVKFGFTKQRFNEDDIEYTGPITNEGDGPFVKNPEGEGYVAATDTTKPYIEFTAVEPLPAGSFAGNTLTLPLNTPFTSIDKFVTAKAYDKVTVYPSSEGGVGETTRPELVGDIDHPIKINTSGTVNTSVDGTYQVVFSVKDKAGNLGTKVLRVVVTP